MWKMPQEKPGSNRRFRVVNLTRGVVLATSVELADRSENRRKGLLGRPPLLSGEGLWIAPCECVHTFFMRYEIDLVYIDRERRVRKLRSGVVPWRISGCFTAHSVLELGPGTIVTTRIQVGDRLAITQAGVQSN